MSISVPETPDKLKDIGFNRALQNELIVAYNANARHGKAHAKTKGEVSGGGKKPWRQKGTGRARSGSNRSPIWKGGGVVFGPRNTTDFSHKISRKKKQAGLLQMVGQKLREGKLRVLEGFELSEPKTAEAVSVLKDEYKIGQDRILVLIDSEDEILKKSFRNIKNLQICNWRSINSADLLKNENILYFKDAWDSFIGERLG
jgi:large subunit ribosomal protein L4